MHKAKGDDRRPVPLVSFRERDPVWLRENAGHPLEEPLKRKVVSYLRRGKVLAARPQIARDHLVSEGRFIGPVKVLTDGTWAWLNVLAHYVQDHDLKVPDEFLAHGNACNWVLRASTIDTSTLRPVYEG